MTDPTPHLTQYLAEQTALLEDISALLRQQTDTPWAARLWSAEDIAQHIGLTKRTVLETIACQPTFPDPIRINSRPRWYAAEVCEWLDNHRK
jgi:predicted DNA-binding transcriptional regulator AlpA